jgi:hypothetical protein
MAKCEHEVAHQFSTIYARTDWSRQEDGTYEPDEVPCSKVLDEETTDLKCAECGADLYELETDDGLRLVAGEDS